MKNRVIMHIVLLFLLSVSPDKTFSSTTIENVELIKKTSNRNVAGLPLDAPHPVFYHLPNSFAPSCGLVAPQGKEITPILEVGPGESYPQCLEVIDGYRIYYVDESGTNLHVTRDDGYKVPTATKKTVAKWSALRRKLTALIKPQ